MPRKPIGPQPMTPAQRKREQRSRDQTAIQERPAAEWTERQCLVVLSGTYGDALKREAWGQLGRLNGWSA
ncbi:MAG: hypothetical protein WED00_08425 [Aquisalimonadaceae bacterium]